MDAARYFEMMHRAMSARKRDTTLLLRVKVQDLGGADAYLELRQEPGSGRVRVQLDAENYREKREQSLQHLARKVAAKVTKYRRNVTLEPMNAYERHVIHTALQDTPGVTTFSIGTEPNRRVVVSYDRTKM